MAVSDASQPAPAWTAWSTDRPELTPAARRMLRHHLGAAQPLPESRLDAARVPPSRLTAAAGDALREATDAGAVATDDAARARHAGGQSLVDLVRRRAGDGSAAPDAVVTPADSAGVAAVLAVAGRHRLAVVPWGGGTSVVGGLDPVTGAHEAVIALDLSRLDRLVGIDEVSLTATFQAGIRTPAAEAELVKHGLTLGHAPQSWQRASLGGYVVTRSAGQASSGIGRIDDLLVGARLVTPTGELTLPPIPSSAAGPDLRRVVLGSEGTLGVVTDVTLRVRRQPETSRYEAWVIGDWRRGQRLLRTLAQRGPLPDVLRLSDPRETALSMVLGATPGWQRRALAAWLRLHRIDGGCLIVTGWEGTQDDVTHRRKLARKAFRSAGAVPIGSRGGESWRRHRFSGPALRDSLLDSGVAVETLETAALWSDLPAVDDAVRRTLADALPGCLVGGHVSHLYPTGASLYFTVLFAIRESDPDALIARWSAAKTAVTAALVEAGGTVTHHHGVGTMHRDFATADLGGPVGRRVLAAVKHELDPDDVCNPGKLLDGGVRTG